MRPLYHRSCASATSGTDKATSRLPMAGMPVGDAEVPPGDGAPASEGRRSPGKLGVNRLLTYEVPR